MTGLPRELQKSTPFLGMPLALVRETYQYCLCLIMVEAGKMELLETVSGENGSLCTFRTMTGKLFCTAQPVINKEQEAAVIEQLGVALQEGITRQPTG